MDWISTAKWFWCWWRRSNPFHRRPSRSERKVSHQILTVLFFLTSPQGHANWQRYSYLFNSLGGAIAISIAQNIFTNGLTANLPKDAPGVDPQIVIGAGAAYLRKVITPEQLPGVLLAYMAGLKQAFIISIACGAIGTICACFVEWKSVKGKKLVPTAA